MNRHTYTVPAYAVVVEAVRRHLAADRISLVGLSFGGFAAVAYVLRHPDRVQRLVASNAAYSADSWQRGNIDNVDHEVRVYHPGPSTRRCTPRSSAPTRSGR